MDLYPYTHLAGEATGAPLDEEKLINYQNWFRDLFEVGMTWDEREIRLTARATITLDRRDPQLGIKLAVISLRLANQADLQNQNALGSSHCQGADL